MTVRAVRDGVLELWGRIWLTATTVRCYRDFSLLRMFES